MLQSYPVPRYQAINFPNFGVVFDAVAEDGKVHTLAGVGVPGRSMWSICDCREYCLSGGFTDERSFRNEDGCREIHWYPAVVDGP